MTARQPIDHDIAKQLQGVHLGIPQALQEQKSQQRMEFLQLNPQVAQLQLQQQLGLTHYSILVDQEWEDLIPALSEDETVDAAKSS